MDGPKRSTSEEPEEPVPGRGETILLVEDNEDLAEVYVEVLETLGYRPLAARSGEEALRIGEREAARIALVFTDMTMPGMGGNDVCRELRARGIRAPIIVLSGHPSPGRSTLDDLGVVEWLQKPLEVEELMAATERALVRTAS